MSLVPSAVESSPVAERSRAPAGSRALWLILGLYLLGAVALTARLWIDPASRVQVGDPEDVDLFAWFMRYAATAVAHGHLPALFTTAMNAPRGINVMWNTSFLLPAVVLSPVTLLLGPQVSLTIALTLGFAGSAASLFWVLAPVGGRNLAGRPGRRGLRLLLGHGEFRHRPLPHAVRGAAAADHRRSAADRHRPRSRPVRTGVWLGLLMAAQVFVGEELLTLTAVAGLVLVVVVAVGRPRSVLRRARGTALGLVTAAVVALAISGYALWVQFHGPLSEHGSPWATGQLQKPGRRPGHARQATCSFIPGPARRRSPRAAGLPGVPGLPGLAAAGRARGRGDPLLARPAGPRDRRDVGGAGTVQPR